MPRKKSELAKTRQNLHIIRNLWINSNENEPFSFTKKLTDSNQTMEEYSVDYIIFKKRT